ncbi:MAG TPA: acyl-CoA dehydrogenase family protein [Caulobacterales bacterium]|nr:acyl-CoA dehydrogenase family protein [Caulobacterales bacterium]
MTEKSSDLRERVRAVLAPIAANAARAEEERRIPDENIALLKETGLFRAFMPRRYGGLELRIEEYGPCIVDISGACSATGWVAGLLAQHVHALALFPRELQDELWADDNDTLVGSSVAPINVAEPADGGVHLSGRFGFSSGCDHAQWYVLGFRHPGHKPPLERHYGVVPRSAVKIVDDWDTLGMRGTGSKSLLLDRAFIPDHRMEAIFALNSGQSKGFGSNESPIYHAAFVPHFSIGFAAVAIGAARRMGDVYAEKIKTRIKAYTGAAATARAPASMRLGRAAHATGAARAFLEKDWRAIDTRCFSGEMPSVDELMRWRTNHGFCIQLAIDAADTLMNGSGAGAWFATSEMQMLWRNVHMCGAHAGTDYDTLSEIYGRHLLGLELDPTL